MCRRECDVSMSIVRRVIQELTAYKFPIQIYHIFNSEKLRLDSVRCTLIVKISALFNRKHAYRDDKFESFQKTIDRKGNTQGRVHVIR